MSKPKTIKVKKKINVKSLIFSIFTGLIATGCISSAVFLSNKPQSDKVLNLLNLPTNIPKVFKKNVSSSAQSSSIEVPLKFDGKEIYWSFRPLNQINYTTRDDEEHGLFIIQISEVNIGTYYGLVEGSIYMNSTNYSLTKQLTIEVQPDPDFYFDYSDCISASVDSYGQPSFYRENVNEQSVITFDNIKIKSLNEDYVFDTSNIPTVSDITSSDATSVWSVNNITADTVNRFFSFSVNVEAPVVSNDVKMAGVTLTLPFHDSIQKISASFLYLFSSENCDDSHIIKLSYNNTDSFYNSNLNYLGASELTLNGSPYSSIIYTSSIREYGIACSNQIDITPVGQQYESNMNVNSYFFNRGGACFGRVTSLSQNAFSQAGGSDRHVYINFNLPDTITSMQRYSFNEIFTNTMEIPMYCSFIDHDFYYTPRPDTSGANDGIPKEFTFNTPIGTSTYEVEFKGIWKSWESESAFSVLRNAINTVYNNKSEVVIHCNTTTLRNAAFAQYFRVIGFGEDANSFTYTGGLP